MKDLYNKKKEEKKKLVQLCDDDYFNVVGTLEQKRNIKFSKCKS